MNNISIIGGDRRNAEVARIFIEEGANVKSYGNKLLTNEKSLEDAVQDSNIIILGIPSLQDKELLKADIPISIT